MSMVRCWLLTGLVVVVGVVPAVAQFTPIQDASSGSEISLWEALDLVAPAPFGPGTSWGATPSDGCTGTACLNNGAGGRRADDGFDQVWQDGTIQVSLAALFWGGSANPGDTLGQSLVFDATAFDGTVADAPSPPVDAFGATSSFTVGGDGRFMVGDASATHATAWSLSSLNVAFPNTSIVDRSVTFDVSGLDVYLWNGSAYELFVANAPAESYIIAFDPGSDLDFQDMLVYMQGATPGPPCSTSAECDDGEACTTDVCNAFGGCVHEGTSGATEVCDGVDNDCDNLTDEDFPDLGLPCTVGVGACAASGVMVCSVDGLGTVCDATPGVPAPDDATCDGIDDDCDGATDEDFVPTVTTCGVGACAGNTGQLVCDAGALIDTCDPFGGAAVDDATCDGVDDDCDGATDEDFVSTPTTCGVGACSGNTGALVCQGGVLVDTCDPFAGAAVDDATCDGIDDDCDGGSDEDFVPVPTTCGVGACAGNTGAIVCQNGAPVDTCDPFGGAAADDATCDGVDDDCDGTSDEEYVPVPTTCGVGACAGNTGAMVCQNGGLVDTCDPFGGAALDDATCDGVDDDCDGVDDEDFVPVPTTCGVGACAGNTGQEICENGGVVDTCDPFAGASPEVCDGVDNNCDGATDEEPSATASCAFLDDQCLVGVCSAGACAAQPANEGGPCDDANMCTEPDVCTAGVCGGLCISILYADLTPVPPNADAIVDVDDVLCVLAANNATPDPACLDADIWPCPPNQDGLNEAGDLIAVLAAAAGDPPCPDECPPCPGACCVAGDPPCVFVPQSECDALGGTFGGANTECGPATCP
ncbi:MAG: MopE-related protein [Phycisphaerae bacterium]